MIQIRNLRKRYGNYWAVDDISLEIGAGEIFGFLGVNGAGKTTTIRMMVGVLRPSAGSIALGGFDMQQQPLEAKAITGYVPDRPYVYGKLTTREFLYFVGELYLVPRRRLHDRIDELLAEFGLTEWQDDLVESLSHGMRQRVATSAALLHGPKILILDEPMVGLDPRGARLLKDCLVRYARQGMTIFLSTHSLDVAEEVADRLAIVEKGQLISSGTLSEIKQKSGDFEGDLERVFLQLTSDMSKPNPVNGGSV